MSQKDSLPHWYVAYTFPNAEKKAHRNLEEMGICSYLPLQKVFRKWSDRTKLLELPLFPNYIFIHVHPREISIPLQRRELLYYISFNGKPAIIKDSLIESLKVVLKENVTISSELIQSGSMVKVTGGVFAGAEGLLLRKSGKSRLVVQIECLNRAVSVEVPSHLIEPLLVDMPKMPKL